jgi:choline kinase
MRAIILAAGRGSRMKTLTEQHPKCFVKVSGRTLLERQLAALGEGGIDEIAIVRGYRGDAFDGLGLTLFDNERWQETNMVSSLRCADQWLGQFECIVSYSDIFYGATTIKELAASRAPLSIAYDPEWRWLWSRRFSDPLSDAETFRVDDAGRIVDIGRRPKSYDEIGGQYMGLLRFTPAAWREVTAHLDDLAPAVVAKLDMTALLNRLLGIGMTIAGVPISEAWGEVDSESDLALYEALAESEPKLQIVLG